jgi:aspartokinase/homoserine dehydrogenase 1
MLIVKFGGTSLADRERLDRAAGIVAAHQGPLVAVVSAIGDTTDRLLEAGAHAEAGNALGASAVVQALREAHREAAPDDPALQSRLDQLFAELSSILEGVRLLRELTPRSTALLGSFGERLSAPLFASLLPSAEAVDAREIIVTTAEPAEAQVLFEDTAKRVNERLRPVVESGRVAVVTGFVGASEEGITTTLGRGGSDYTATLLGSLLDADEIHIYTDVDGVLTADPRLVGDARSLPRVTYREAAEMSYFGARVLHPRTIQPAAAKGIPVRVRSSFQPELSGTLIAAEAPTAEAGVKTVTSARAQALVTIDGRGMAGVPGVARRIFEASELAGVNVVMISQASSEQTVSLVVPGGDAPALCAALEQRFAPELAAGAIDRVEARQPVSVVSIIGEGMAGSPGIAGRLFSALGQAQVNVLAIAQGSSELSISVALDEAEVERAVRAAHSAFGLTHVVNLLVLGSGTVGATLLTQLAETREAMRERLDLELRVVGLATSKKLLFDGAGLDPAAAVAALDGAEPRPDDGALIARFAAEQATEAVLIDATAAELTELHRAALAAGVHVVTANKKPVSDRREQTRALFAAARQSGVRYCYETTFGAGLPVLHTLEELINTGDRILGIRGCLSGTLGFVVTRLDEGTSLLEATREAQQLGFTEPDPREDLSGADVGRKALIIARAAGFDLEPEDVQLDPLVPGLEQGLEAACERFEKELAVRRTEAELQGQVLRYIAEITPESTRVGLHAVPADSPIGVLRGPDNILVFRTNRYDELPLVIRGPGAGAEVTAAGVLGDVLKIARRI